MTDQLSSSIPDAKSTVYELVLGGKLLTEIILSGTYSKEIREEAFRVLRENVVSVHRIKKQHTPTLILEKKKSEHIPPNNIFISFPSAQEPEKEVS